MRKLLYSGYAILCYGIFFAAFLYMIGFVENIAGFSLAASFKGLFPKTLDAGPVTFSILPAIGIDLALIALFGIQHSVMARPGFKQKWTKIIAAPIERSTYVLFASILLILLFYGWQPVKGTIWDFRGTVMGTVFFWLSMAGWGLLLLSTFLINHFDLFGLRQVYRYARNEAPRPVAFRTPLLYQLVRHPLYLSFLMAFWFAPLMTLSHLLFAAGMTAYIFIGIYHEEKDLVRVYGEPYRAYRAQVPRIIPFTRSGKKTPALPQREPLHSSRI